MNNWLKVLRNPVLIFGLMMIGYGLLNTLRNDNIDFAVRSDGRGYYAYLPALFIYNDGSFEKSAAAEKAYYEHGIDQLYLFKDTKGKTYNKYFPGIAVLQAPFFGIACAVSKISGYPVDGYSAIFRWCYYIGSLFYVLCGLLLFLRCLQKLFPEEARVYWLIPVFYVVSPLLFYCLVTPSFTHLYSFFLFGCFAWQILTLKEAFRLRKVFLTGVILGLIVLLRPTNLAVILIIPFLLGSASESKRFLKKLVEKKGRKLFAGIGGFLLMISLVFISWKWQTGNWIVWSYSGEGFTFLHPHLFAVLFSFRTGLFLHSPAMWLSLAGLVIMFRKNRRNRFKAIWWSIYFFVNVWIVASWWCWDYESPFGNRPLTEHFIFLLIPAVYVFLQYRKLAIVLLGVFSLLGIIRFYEIESGFMSDQRFTKSNYLISLQFWKSEYKDRWNFTRSCVPFGKMIDASVLLDQREQNITPENEFVCTVEKSFPKRRTNERFSYRVELEKWMHEVPVYGVMLVIDAYNKDNSKRYYKTTELFNDRFEGNRKWSEKLIFEGHIHDYLQEYDFVKIYIWNQSRKEFKLRNVKFVLEEYKS